MQEEFGEFQDRLTTFKLWKGRKAEDFDDDTEGFMGKFKVSDRSNNQFYIIMFTTRKKETKKKDL